MDGPEDRIAVTNTADEDTDADQVVDVVELATAHDHLLIDRVQLLGPPHDASADPQLTEVRVDGLDDVADVLLALGCPLKHETLDLGVQLRVEYREAQVLEFGLDRLNTEPVRQGRVDLEGLRRLLPRLLGRHEAPGARVVESIGELDEQDADVARHRDDHLADGLGLRALAVLDLVEFGDAVDQHRHLVAELRRQVVEPVGGVLDRIVEERRGDRPRSEPQVGEDLRDRERMRDVRLAALPRLTTVRLVGDRIGALEDDEVALGMVRPHRPQQLLDIIPSRRPREDPRHESSKRRCRRGGNGLCQSTPYLR